MASWTTLTDALLAVNKYLSSDTAKALRDNVTASFEGATGAPRLNALAIDADIGELIGVPTGSFDFGSDIPYQNGGTPPASSIEIDDNTYMQLASAYIYGNASATARFYAIIHRSSDDNNPQLKVDVDKWESGSWANVHTSTTDLTTNSADNIASGTFTAVDTSAIVHRITVSMRLASGSGTDILTPKVGSFISWQ